MNKIETELSYWKEKAEAFSNLLQSVRVKCRADGDIEYEMRDTMREYLRIRDLPLPGTPQYMEIHGIPFDD